VRRFAPPGAVEVEAAPADDLAPDRAVVSRALSALTPEQRQVLELGYYLGLSSSEIAAQVAIPLGTVKSRMASALARLRAALPDHDTGGAP
jgi:RNA polymerase sigma-70 factor (ECF subfamily)